MSLNYKIRKERDKREYYKKLELLRKVLKALQCNDKMSLAAKRHLMFKLNLLSRGNKSKVAFLNLCLNSSRSKGVYSFFRLSRSHIKKLVSFDCLPGIAKSSW